MAFTINNRRYEDELGRFTALLEKLQEFLKQSGSNLVVRSTKLGGYERKLRDIGLLGARDAAGLTEIMSRYNQLDAIFLEDSKVKFKAGDLHSILEGQTVLHDLKEDYNDIFFELSMAVRCAASFPGIATIDMTSICDVIVDEKIAIECKYLHGKKGLRDNVAKGLAQLDQRVDAGLAKAGFVAIDVSALLDKDKIWEFAQGVFDCFLSSNEKLCKIGRLEQDEILVQIASDSNFQSIITGFVAHQAEFVFWSNFGRSEIEKMTANCYAVIYQYSNAFCFDDERDGRLPIPFRGTGYCINPMFSGEAKGGIEKYIHSMAPGI